MFVKGKFWAKKNRAIGLVLIRGAALDVDVKSPTLNLVVVHFLSDTNDNPYLFSPFYTYIIVDLRAAVNV